MHLDPLFVAVSDPVLRHYPIRRRRDAVWPEASGQSEKRYIGEDLADGKQVAYVLSVPRHPLKDDDGPAWSELHVVNEAGESRPFIAGKVDLGDVQWTPDGRSIAFVSKRPGDENASLYVIPVDGGEARWVVAHSTDLRGVTFSADGKQSRCWPRIRCPKNSRISAPRDSSRRFTRRTCRWSRLGRPG